MKGGRKHPPVESGPCQRSRARDAVPSPYRAMWLLAMFDLPVTSKAARKAYGRFRKELLRDGFIMLQFSVYGRYCASEDAAHVHLKRVAVAVPSQGQVRVMMVTDIQFGK